MGTGRRWSLFGLGSAAAAALLPHSDLTLSALTTFSERRGRLETGAAWWRREGQGKWKGQLETAWAF